MVDTKLRERPKAEMQRRSRKLLMPGRNCRQIATAAHAAVLIDAEAYFAALEQAFRSARRSIFIVGWDFDSRIRLRPQDGPSAPDLGSFLRSLVEQHSDLEVRILIWSLATLHAPGAAAPLLLGEEWQKHPRIHLRLDTHHPIHAAHHQKIVTIDDSLAFVGGMDLTIGRWDTVRHEIDEPLRQCPDGSQYKPVHDVQMAVDGQAARVVAKVVRDRWCAAQNETVPLGREESRWPEGLKATFTAIPVAVARTLPAYGGTEAVEEAAQLTDDMLRAARKSIYIEAQYFTAKRLRPVIKELLQRPNGPEIVVVGPLNADGVIERFIMGANRVRLMRYLRPADPHGRLKVYCPIVKNGQDECHLLVHAKLIIVDDRLIRVGSANLNNRSMGLDTECDLAIQAEHPKDRAAIARCRDELLAEHLGVAASDVRTATERTGSLIAAIEALSDASSRRQLRPVQVDRGPIHSFPGTRLLDPERPFRFVEKIRRLWKGQAQRGSGAALLPESSSSEPASRTLPKASGTRK